MGPFCFVDKLLDKDGTDDRTGFSSRTDVLDVSDVGFDLLAVILADRKLPEILAGLFSAVDDLVDEELIIAHNACVDIAESDHHTACERGHIDDSWRTVLLGISDGVSKDQATLRIGIQDLNCLAIARLYDVTRPRSFAIRHVLDGGHNTHYRNSRLDQRDRPHGTEHG